MTAQAPYRGGENKKEKPTKVEKVWNAGQKAKRKAEALKKTAAV